MTPSPIEIRLLGPVEVLVHDAPLAVDTRKALALVAYLAATGAPAPRARVAALLWPEADADRASGALRRTLSVLHAGLGGAGLEITRSSVALDLDAVDVDLVRFTDALARSRAHAHPDEAGCAECRAALAQAVSLARGPFMDGFSLRDSDEFDEWQLGEGEHVRAQVAGALERHARTCLAAGNLAAAIETAGRWLALDPLHEPAHRVAMSAHAAAGETGAAIAQYRACVRVLDAELGVAPLAETTALYEAIREGLPARLPPAERPSPRTRRTRPTRAPLVAREGELTGLLATWAAASPDGRLIAIEGEAGIGKTHVLDSLADAVARRGGRIARVACHEGERALAFAAVGTLIRARSSEPDALERLGHLPAATRAEVARFVPELADSQGRSVPRRVHSSADPTARTRLFEGLIEALDALVAGPVPGLAAIEDLQWADESSIELVAYLARRLVGRRMALVVSWRREDLDAAALRFALEADRVAASHLRLDRLSPGAALDLARAVGRDQATGDRLERVAIESEGLPLYVVAALAAGMPSSGRLPAGIVALQRERLASVGEASAQVLTAAAVLGRSFDLATVRGVSGRSDDEAVAAMEELTRRGIARELPMQAGSDLVFDFTHASLRDVAYEDASLARRRLLHRRAADVLRAARRGPSGAIDWSLIARHEHAGGREAEAAAAFVRAGDAAREIQALREAIDAYTNALALGASDPAAVHEAIGGIEAATGDYAAAIVSLEAAAAEADGTSVRLASIEHHLGRVHLFRGDLSAAESHLAAALAALPTGPSPRRARLLGERASVALRAGEILAASEAAASALAMASDAGDHAAAAQALRVLGLAARASGATVLARERLTASLAAAVASGDLAATIATRNALALVEADEGRVDEAVAQADAALESARRAGYRHVEAAVENNLADILHAAGRDAESRDHQRRAVARFAEVADAAGDLEPEIWKLAEW